MTSGKQELHEFQSVHPAFSHAALEGDARKFIEFLTNIVLRLIGEGIK